MSFAKILIANRGEIAVRIARTARALGYRTVAVASAADARSPHLEAADEAVILDPVPGGEPYLAIDRLLAAAERTGADAIHPGYGFLAEDAGFARAVAASGRVFIGPDAEAIRLMGHKALAKRCAAAVGVPCLDGYGGSDQSPEALAAAAERLGYPLLVKAAAGGGGRGLRRVAAPAQLGAALASARSEAASAFGHGDLLLEPLVEAARHVEIQVFGDRHGGAIHLGERECSIQRRYQKLIEESPSPAVAAPLRAALTEAAVALVRSIGYVGAGTVEFLLRPDGSFCFLEMNTRLQVEHPVTELVTGLDLVEWQLRVAAGEPLPAQDEIVGRGHAIEARLCAEDPAADFAPQTGRIHVFNAPAGAGLRVDHALAAGFEVSGFYDSLLAKVCAWGRDRDEARRRLELALAQTRLLGPATNRDFLRQVLAHPAFVAGETTTDFLDQHFPPAARAAADPGAATLALAAVLLADAARAQTGELWGFRNSGTAGWPLDLGWAEGRATLRIEIAEGAYRVRVAEREIAVAIRSHEADELRCAIDGSEERAVAWLEGGELWLDHGGAVRVFHEVLRAPTRDAHAGDTDQLRAPMSARVIAVEATVGQRVEAGQCLVVLEAMKLESRVTSERAGVVAEVWVAVGDQVRHRQPLLRLAKTG